MEDKKVRSITLTITHSCNLNCSYCYEKHKNSKRMTFDTAINIVEKELNDESNLTYDYVEIDFFGGEPLLEFELIKDIVDYVKAKKYKNKYVFFATTNGTILTEEMKLWFAKNRDQIVLGLSLDGTREMHNTNRSNSYDKIDVDFYAKYYSDQGVKMTISPETLPSLAEGVIHCNQLGFKVFANLAYDIDWSNKINKQILEEQLKKLVDYYIANKNQYYCSMLDIERLFGVGENNGEIIRTCGAGWTMRAYDYDGELYPCQHFLPISIGEEKAKQSKTLKFERNISEEDHLDVECRKCIFVNTCPNCYGSNFSSTGNMHSRDLNFCTLIKIQYMACSYYVLKMYENNLLDLEDPKNISILNSAIIVNELMD